MKKILLIILLLSLFIIAKAEITYGIFPSLVYLEHGFFVGPQAKVSAIDSEIDIYLGPRAAWVINHSLMIGGSYNWNLNHALLTKTNADSSYYAKSHYGGMEIEYNFFAFQPVHFSIYSLVGFGRLDILLNDKKYVKQEDYFVYEPGIFLKVNMTDHFHIGAGATYRLIDELTNPFVTEKELGGLTANVVFKFGWF